MKFLIAGLGSIGRRHLRNLLALGEKDILLYRTHQSTLPEGDLANFPVETDLEAALNREPEAVIISNPTSLHLDVAIPAARKGYPIFLEKPISHTMEGVDKLVHAVNDRGVKVLVGYQFRFHPGLKKVNDLLFEGAIGRPLSVRAHWGEFLPGWHPWEDYRDGYSARADLGGGVILTLSHPLDYLRWMLGEVTEVWSFSSSIGDLELTVEDTAEIGLHFANGVIGSVHLDYNQQPPTHYVELIGTDGTMQWEYAFGGVKLYRKESNEWQTWSLPESFERNDMFLAEMRHFREVVGGSAEPVCSLEDGIHALLLARAALDSCSLKRLVEVRQNI